MEGGVKDCPETYLPGIPLHQLSTIFLLYPTSVYGLMPISSIDHLHVSPLSCLEFGGTWQILSYFWISNNISIPLH